MEELNQQYRCRDCDNVSWRQEVCHEVPMEPTCYCGSGEFLEECHGDEPPVEPESLFEKASE